MGSKNIKVMIGSLIIVGAIVYFGFAGYEEGRSYYKTIGELSEMGDDAYEKRIRVAGIVSEGSIQRQGDEILFQIEQDDLKLSVLYTGTRPVPDTFKDGAEALCDGHYKPDGTFEATQIQAKCASKYEAEYGTTQAES
ncbi:MAG: cytochrome c maturation protein CcmE [bacterium]|nr:cytochrome c maturation protein CcmE [bacterium]